MNPALMQNSCPMFPINNNDFKYQCSNRHYHSNPVSASDYSLERKQTLVSGSVNQSVTVGNPSNGIDYSANALTNDTSCHANGNSLILTPPHSGDEASSTALNAVTSSYGYSSQNRVPVSNASNSEYYSNPAPSYLASSYEAANMTNIARKIPAQMPAPLSPPYYPPNFTSNNGFPPFGSMTRGGMDYGSYSTGNGRHSVHFDLFNGPRQSSYLSGSYPSSMPAHMANNSQLSRISGPPFEPTEIIHELVNTANQQLPLEVQSSITKGFFQVADKWTCYRRNYFTVTCGFAFKTTNYDQVYLSRYKHRPEQVHAYAVSISAKTSAPNAGEGEVRGLVQHTPKRDKATESVPTRHQVMPATQNSMGGLGLSQHGLYSNTGHLNGCLTNTLDGYNQASVSGPQSNYTFERIQFQKATANNGKRRAQQQYFHVVVNLEVNVGRPGGSDEWVLVASRVSQPMVVRGRSPGHYKDNRRDSQAGKDTDGGSGHGGDNDPSVYSMQRTLTQRSPNSMTSAPSHYRSNQHYGNSSATTYSMNDSDSTISSSNASTTTTIASSPGKGENYQIASDLARRSLSDANFMRNRLTLSPIQTKDATSIMHLRHSRKRSFEDITNDCADSFFSAPVDSGYNGAMNPTFDFNVLSTSQTLCT